MKIQSIYYHNPDYSGFERMIKYHLSRGYRFIDVFELYDILANRKPIKSKLAFISFDDGWQGNLNAIPIIEHYNVPICIFVSTNPLYSGNFWWEYVAKVFGFKKVNEIKKLPYMEFCNTIDSIKSTISLKRSALTVNELVKLSKHPLVSIQAHTVHHPILTNVPDNVLHKELSDAKDELELITKSRVISFSYTNGSVSFREIEACKQYYLLAFTTEQRRISNKDNLFLLPRFALTGDFFRDLLKIWGIWRWIIGIKNFITFKHR